MNPQKDLPALTPEENFKLENDLLKAKLTAEFGMTESDTTRLDAEMENQWLNYIYEFENSYKDAKQTTVYKFIGKPEFRSPENDKLSENEIASELDRLLGIMADNGIRLDVLCDYENEEELIYKFITEELFHEEMDDMRIEGMNHCYIYEEFHTNHKYDLTNDSENFLYNIFESEWNAGFHNLYISDRLEFDRQSFKKEEFEKLIMNFQNSVRQFKLISKEVKEVQFDLEKGIANVSGVISCFIETKNLSGEFMFDFIFNDHGYWNIYKIGLPEGILSV